MEEKDKPLVSIITVCLNSEKTIEQTIQSVINQTYSNIEYSIIDGKSTDRTLEIIDEYKDKITIFVSERDAGIYDAMNKGLKLATGELIGIINSDDWYEPDAVDNIVTTSLEDITAQIFYGNINIYDEDKFLRTRSRSPLKELHTRMAIPHPTVFIKSEVYKKYGFNTKYKIRADRDLLLKLYSKKYKFKYIYKIIANFRLGGYNESNHSKKIIEDIKISLHYPDNFMNVLRIFFKILIDLRSIVCGYIRKYIRHFVD